MLITVLVILFVAVFGFLAWRILTTASADKSKPDEAYTCPVCNEYNCVCNRKDDQ